MPSYTAPLRDMRFVLFELLQAEAELKSLPAYESLDGDTINAIFEEAARFAETVIHPLNAVGDREGCTYHGNGVVTAPSGFKAAYAQYVESGWPSLACASEFGGQGLPIVVNNAAYEMFNSANQAWLMYAGLSHSAYACLKSHGSPEMKALYLPKIVSGEWTGTMCLTEPHCGTDLGLLRTRADTQNDGSYLLTGSKIFISAGEHDLAENILHLVLARLPDAPKGTKGISLFLVPKFVPNSDGSLGARNGIHAGSIEHKMGIHGNATCVMNLDSARGWLIGEENKGLNAMFVMMNSARLGVGMQSLGLAEAAYQNAVAYARNRLQSRAATGAKQPEKSADPIIVHPDVRRMLLTAKAYTEGGRAFTTWIAQLIDRELSHPDLATRTEAGELVTLLTPVVKAFITDNSFETNNLALQVFGGHGYIEEWGMSQYVRDSRINMIYEGTNGIQALDLLARKILGDGGKRLQKFGAIIAEFAQAQAERPDMQEFIAPLIDLGKNLTQLSMEIAGNAARDANEVGAAANHYLRIVGHLVYGYLWARMARIALDKADSGDTFYVGKLHTARFYFQRLLPETAYHFQAARAGAASLMAIDESLF